MPNERKKRNVSAPSGAPPLRHQRALRRPSWSRTGPYTSTSPSRHATLVPNGTGLPSPRQQLAPLGDSAEKLVHAALEPRRVGRLDLQAGQHVLPDAGRRKQRAGTQFAQVALYGLRAFRAVARRADHEAGAQREHRVADPAHRQVTQPVVSAPHRFHAGEAFRRGDHVAMTEQHALGPAGGAGRIGDQCDVVGATLVAVRARSSRDAPCRRRVPQLPPPQTI